jgi:CRISPR-associated protein (TIGR03984 family)
MTLPASPPRLAIFVAKGLSLEQALAAFASTCGPDGAVGFTLAPTAFSFIRLDASGRATGPGGPFDLAAVYEARVFHERAELRWLRDPCHDSGHSAVLLTDGSCAVDLPARNLDVPLVDTEEQTYVLWGRPDREGNVASGWTRLTAARIGGFDVPIAEAGGNDRVVLRTLEYLGQLEDGNVAVIEERLCGLGTYEER